MTDLMDERMDQRLSAAARRWQAEQPALPVVPLDRLDEPLPRRVSWRAGMAAAAAVLVVGGGVAGVVRTIGGSSSTPSTQPTSSPATHGATVGAEVVPWRDLPAKHPKVGHRVHGTRVTKYDGVVAGGHISGTAQPGDTLVFTAFLESDTDLVLVPCPDFSIAFGRKYGHTWQLNCAQVPYRDGQGRPLLPASKRVRFEMRVTVPDEHGRQKVLWTLDGPQSMPGFYGLVRVE